MKKLIPFALLVIAVLFIFYNEGAFDKVLGSGVPEEQLISDISANNSDIRRAGLSITDIEILSSECDKDLGIYSYSVKYSAENADASYTGSMSLTYMKHNDTWAFSKYEDGDTFYEPKNACDESVAKAYIQSEYEELGAVNAQLDFKATADADAYIPGAVDMTSSWHSFSYIVSGKENSVCSWSDSWHISGCFDLNDGWQVVDATRERLKETWDICGKYSFANETFSTTVDVISFDVDLEGDTVTLVWSWQFTKNGVTSTSNGQETKVLDLEDNNSYAESYGNLANVYFCGRGGISWDTQNDNAEGVGIFVSLGGGYTYWVDGVAYWLTKQ